MIGSADTTRPTPISGRPMIRTSDSPTATRSVAELVTNRFRCPQDVADFVIDGDLSRDPGYFRMGSEGICFGQCSSGAPAKSVSESLHDAGEYIIIDRSSVHLPFDPVQIVDNLRSERYNATWPKIKTLSGSTVFRSIYYRARPLLPTSARRHIQKLYFRGWDKIPFPRWPVDATVECIFEHLLMLSMRSKGVTRLPFIWFWPDGAPSCTMVTHDVETTEGLRSCKQLMDLDDSFEIKASFQIIPERRYRVTSSALADIKVRGFEVNVHDLNHDGLLMNNKNEFLRRIRRINNYGRQFGARGFRSAQMYRDTSFLGALDFSYDMSIPSAAHLEPQQGGCCTVFPFFIGDIVELPLTTTQDYSLFMILNDYSLRRWKEQIALIREKSGLISFIIHPDYVIEPRAREAVTQLLQHLSDLRSAGKTWLALPNEVASWWRLRSALCLVRVDGKWEILGDGSERARLAYAVMENDRISYELVPAMAGTRT